MCTLTGMKDCLTLETKKEGNLDFRLMFFSCFFTSVEDEDKDKGTVKESAFSQLIREQIIKGDVNTEVPNLARMVKIVLASMHEGMSVNHI